MINCIDIPALSNDDLLTEYMDLKRVVTLAKRHIDEPWNAPPVPEYYRCGLGNRLFFTDKLFWVTNRLVAGSRELKTRMIQFETSIDANDLGHYANIIKKMPRKRLQDWQPKQADFVVNFLHLIKTKPQEYVCDTNKR